MNINQRREIIIEDMFANHDFGDEVVKEVNGWERENPDCYKRVVFLERDEEPSQKVAFYVIFERGTLNVKEKRVQWSARFDNP